MTQQALSRLRYGADPEVFLARKVVTKHVTGIEGKRPKVAKEQLIPVPITGMVGGTKARPLELTNKLPGWEGLRIPKGAMVQEDGTALEFNVAPAADTHRLLVDCNLMMSAINEFAAKKGLLIHQGSSAEFAEDYKKSHAQAFVIGCDPDFNAYTQQVRRPPDVVVGSLIRHAGGHFHVGYDKALVPPHIVVQFLDLFLGLPSLNMDRQGLRRQFYGQAGSYREKDYGVEYRTLSNFWLYKPQSPAADYHNPAVQALFEGAETLMETLISDMGVLEHLYRTINWQDVAGAINTENHAAGQQVIGFATKIAPKLFRHLDRYELYSKEWLKTQTRE